MKRRSGHLTSRRARRVLVVGALVASGGIIAAVVQYSQAGSPPPTASVFVATTGSDSNRCSQAAPCATFNRAYQVAKPGDIVEVAAGVYDQQTVVQTRPPKGGPAIAFRPAAGARVSVGGIQLGVNSGQPSGTAPSYLVFDGFDINGQFHASYSGVGPGPSNIILKNSHVHQWDAPGPLLELRDLVDSSFVNNEIGPGCCNADGIELAVRDYGSPNPRNVLFDRLYVHDIGDTCQMLPNYSDCAGTGYGDGPAATCYPYCDHIDGIQAFGSTGLTITNSRFYNAGTQNIFLFPSNGGSFTNVLIENTMVSNSFGPGATNSVSVADTGASSFSGYVKFRFNTFQRDVRIYEKVLAPGTQVEFIGNIASYHGDGGGTEPCTFTAGDGSTITPTYSHNLFGRKTCGATDILGSPKYVSPSFATPDLHLQRGSLGIGRGDVDNQPGRDIDGDVRPLRRAPDIGADQRETAALVLGRSIGRLRLGALRSEVVAFFGEPKRVKHFVSNRSPVSVAFYSAHGGSLSVWYSGNKVVGAGTSTSYYATSAGSGVGSETELVRKATGSSWVDCRHAYRRRTGGVAVYLTPSGGKEHGARVDSILMVLPGFDVAKADPKAAKKKSRTSPLDCRPRLR